MAEQLRGKFPKLGALSEEVENDVLPFMIFPWANWTQIYSTNPLQRLSAEIKRHTRVVGIFPNGASITQLVNATLLEQYDEWSLTRRYMQLEGLQSLGDTVPTLLSAVAR